MYCIVLIGNMVQYVEVIVKTLKLLPWDQTKLASYLLFSTSIIYPVSYYKPVRVRYQDPF